jgi:integration host factor subunit alpha
MSLMKIDIIDAICEHLDTPKKDGIRIVESLFDIIKDELDQVNNVMISGFGKWTAKAKKKRRGRNPQTGKVIAIDARKAVSFKSSQVLRKDLI